MLHPSRYRCEPLESRLLLSTINWANRNNASNNFAATFGVFSGSAMAVVDEVLNQYERIITSFNYSGGTTQYNINISMNNQPTNPFGGLTNSNQVVVNGSGAPQSANVLLGAGNDVNGDGVGDGDGWWLDPTPQDFAEFTTVVNAFCGEMDPSLPAADERDFYSLVAHEVGHAMGMTSANGSDWETFIPGLTTDTGVGDSSGGGSLSAFSNATVGRAVLTDTDLGNASGLPVHTAIDGQSFMFNGQQYTSALDVMNNTSQGAKGRRRFISNLYIGLVSAVANYTFVWPEQFGSMYTSLDTTTGQLTLRGGAGTSSDILRVVNTGNGYDITVDVGTDVPGTGPTNAFESSFTDAQVSSIVIDAGDGADTIEIRSLGSNEPVTVNAAGGDDVISLGTGDFDSELLSPISVAGGGGDDRLIINDFTDGVGSDTYTLTATTVSKPARTATFSGIQRIRINGSDNNDVYNLEEFDGPVTVDGRGGNDTFNITPTSADLDSITGPVTLLGDTGVDTLNLFDSSDTVTDDYLFDDYGADNLNFIKPANPGNFTGMQYSGMESLLLEANPASNSITVTNVLATNVTLDGNGGTDELMLDDSADVIGADTHTFDLGVGGGRYSQSDDASVITFRATEHVLVDGSTANNQFVVDAVPLGTDLTIDGHSGSDSAIIGGGDFANIRGPISFTTFNNGTVTFNDSANNNFNIIYTLSAGDFTTAGFTHTFENINDVSLLASNQGDHINIDHTFSYSLDVTANDGADLIRVGGGSVLNLDEMTIRGGGGADELHIDDTTNNFAPTTYSVDQGGGLPFVSLFNGGTTIVYDNVTDLYIDASPLADSITSIAIPSSTHLHINGNGGDDFIDVQGHPTQNNALLPRVTVDGGAGNENVQVNTDPTGSAYVDFTQNQILDRLAFGTGGHARLTAGNRVIEVLSTVVMPTSGAELDLTNGNFVRRNSTNYAFYDARVITGYNAGAWNGLGINSSTAEASALGDGLGLAVAGDLFGGGAGNIGGIALQAGDLIVRYTLYGDANLDRSVNVTDLGLLATSWQLTGRRWNNGDSNFDHTVNVTDLGSLATNWQAALPAPPLSAQSLPQRSAKPTAVSATLLELI